MREADNIHDVSELGIDWVGLDFRPDSPRLVLQIPSNAGFIPDRGSFKTKSQSKQVKLCGVFANDMPQNIVTRAFNFHLDLIQLNGIENAVMIDNLRRTLVPDIRPEIKIIKQLDINHKNDFEKCKPYIGYADYFLFKLFADSSTLDAYTDDIPFLLETNTIEEVERVKHINHPAFIGVDINEGFEIAPARKDIDKLRRAIASVL